MRAPLLTLVLAILVAGCSAPQGDAPADGATPGGVLDPGPTDAAPAPGDAAPPQGATGARTTKYGVSLSPRSYDATEFNAFFDLAKEAGGVVLWGGSPEELADSSAAPTIVTLIAHQKGMPVVIQVGYVTEAGPKPFTEADRMRWKNEAVGFALRQKPEYFALGVEVDRFVAGNEAFFRDYSAWFNETYDAIKANSPQTKVFVTYQYERVMGMTGGLYGGPASSPPAWHVLDLFAKADLVAFTTYPGLVIQDVAALPGDHYAAIATHTSKRVAFTEVGHFGTTDAPGWGSSKEEMAAFVTQFHAQVAPLDPELAIWLHMHDQPTAPSVLFRTMGFFDGHGTRRPAFDAWIAGQTAP